MGSLSVFKSPTDRKGRVYSIIITVPFEVLNAGFMTVVENLSPLKTVPGQNGILTL